MKLLFSFVLASIVLAGAGCSSLSQESMPKKTSQGFQLTASSQTATFLVAHAWSGGMGSMPILDASGNVQKVDGLPVYVAEARVKEIKEKGNMPSCVEGKPKIEVTATIHLEKKEDTNSSVEDAPVVSYYVAKIDELKKVKIDAKKCE